MSAYDQSLQKMLLSTMMNSFTEMDGYTESFNQDGTFESNYAANLRMFSYNNGDSDVTCTSYSLCSPEGIALFIIGGTTSMLDSDDYTTFTDITSSVKLSTSSSTSSSKSYTQYSAGVYKVGTDLPAGNMLYSLLAVPDISVFLPTVTKMIFYLTIIFRLILSLL